MPNKEIYDFPINQPGYLGRQVVLFDEILGAGAEGLVYHIRVEQPTADWLHFAAKIPHPGCEWDPDFGSEIGRLPIKQIPFSVPMRGPEKIILPNGIQSQAILMPIYTKGTLEGQKKIREAQGNPLTIREVAAIMAQAAIAIKRSGLVHGDLKPSNLMVHEDGSIAVSDWGLSSEKGVRLMSCPGTPKYIAPEGIRAAPRDERLDVFALGFIGYELATRRPARIFPETDNRMDMLDTIANQDRKLKTKEKAFDTILKEATRHQAESRSTTIDLLCDLSVYEEAYRHYPSVERKEIAERLLERREHKPERSPDIDRAALAQVLSSWDGDPIIGKRLSAAKAQLDSEEDRSKVGLPRTRLDNLLAIESLQRMAGTSKIIPSENIRGEALRLDAAGFKNINPRGVHAMHAQWAKAIEEGNYTEAQRNFILDTKKLIPHLQNAHAGDVGRIIVKDWELFKRAAAPQEREVFVSLLENKSIAQGIAIRKNGDYVRDGLWVTTSTDGALEKTVEYKQGSMHGTAQEFHKNGQIAKRITYSDGELHGDCTYYGLGGKVQKIESYDKGRMEKVRSMQQSVGVVPKNQGVERS